MQLIDGQPVFSATDLVGYLACEHLTALERTVLHGNLERPHRDDRELEVIRKRGFQHEARYLDELRADGRAVAVIERDDETDRGERIRRQASDTLAATSAPQSRPPTPTGAATAARYPASRSLSASLPRASS